MLDELCVLSLTYQNDGYVTILIPLRDHLRPEYPPSSPLLGTTGEYCFTRLSGGTLPGEPGFEEAQWIASEDVNVKHLLDVFATIDRNSDTMQDGRFRFIAQPYRHKSRPITLGSKIEALPDDHPSKAQCLL